MGAQRSIERCNCECHDKPAPATPLGTRHEEKDCPWCGGSKLLYVDVVKALQVQNPDAAPAKDERGGRSRRRR